MFDSEVYPLQVQAVTEQALKEGLAQANITPYQAYLQAKKDIRQSRSLSTKLYKSGFIKQLPQKFIDTALKEALKEL